MVDFNQYLYYDVTSPTFLKWSNPTSKRILVNSVAGCICNGRVTIGILGKHYLLARVVCSMFGMEIDGLDVDHRDGNPLNNAIENLRVVPHAINMRNTTLQENNRSGITGVNRKEIYDRRSNYLYAGWRAEWRSLEGKNCTKLFSIRKYGEEMAFKLACEHREKMLEELNIQGAGYSTRHGT